MFFKLFLLFTIVPLIELALLIKVGTFIGTLNTIAIVMITGVAGAFLAKTQGVFVLREIQTDLSHGRLPSDRLFDAACVLVGGVFLVTPGLLTDFAGFFLLVPMSRMLVKGYVMEILRNKVQNMSFRRFDRFGE